MKINAISTHCVKKHQSFGDIDLKREYGRPYNGEGNRGYTDIERGLIRIEERQIENECVQQKIMTQNRYILSALGNLASIHNHHTWGRLSEEANSVDDMKSNCYKGKNV